jgi:hypothetical protein
LSQEVEAMLPALMGTLAMLTGQAMKSIDPHVKNPGPELWERVLRLMDLMLCARRAGRLWPRHGDRLRLDARGLVDALSTRDPAADGSVARGVRLTGTAMGGGRRRGREVHPKLAPALKRASRPVGAWNTFVIETQCCRLSATLNGELVSSLGADNSRPLRGHIGLQAHHPGSRVQCRNIRIHER